MVKRPKLSLIFDEEKRKEYLTGFRKRKLERKLKAKQLAEERLKEEIKAVKSKYREAARKRLENVILPTFLEEPIETVKSRVKQVVGNHTVTIEEIDIGNSHYFMGSNKDVQDKPHVEDPDIDQKMTLKKALKMNPTKNKKGRRHVHSKKTKTKSTHKRIKGRRPR